MPSGVAVFSSVLLTDAGEYGTPSVFNADNMRAAHITQYKVHGISFHKPSRTKKDTITLAPTSDREHTAIKSAKVPRHTDASTRIRRRHGCAIH